MELLCLFVVLLFLPINIAAAKINNVSINCASIAQGITFSSDSVTRLALHRVDSSCSPVDHPEITFSDVVVRDGMFINDLLSRRGRQLIDFGAIHATSTAGPTSTTVENGLKYNNAFYVANIKLGTPAGNYLLTMATSNTLTWLQCLPCTGSCYTQVGPLFDPSKSSTYKTLPCNDTACHDPRLLSSSGCSSKGDCAYNLTYASKAFTLGVLSKDSLTIGTSIMTLPDFVYGCGQDNEGFSRLDINSAGIMGLSRGSLSLSSQLGAKFGNVFAYCLPTSTATGMLSFGTSANDPSKYIFTNMYTDLNMPDFYIVHSIGMIVNGDTLKVPTFDMVVDTGTFFTYLPPALYSALRTAFVASMSKYTKAPAQSFLDTCYQVTSADAAVPTVVILFDGVKLQLASRQVLYDITSTISCLSFADTNRTGGTAIFGTCHQELFTLAFDLSANNSRLGFALGDCVPDSSSSSPPPPPISAAPSPPLGLSTPPPPKSPNSVTPIAGPPPPTFSFLKSHAHRLDHDPAATNLIFKTGILVMFFWLF